MSAAPRTIETSGLSGKEPDDLRRVDRLLEQAAWIMMPMGFILILLGWYGASRTVLSFEQIPYLISGGLLGMGLMIGGGLLYVGSWIARATQLIRKEAPETANNLATMLQGLVGDGAVNGNGVSIGAGQFVRTPSGGMYHRSDCAIVSGRVDVKAVPASQVEKFKPCGMCDPLAV